ncbi:MAG: coproporphyrinogen-III oxidase family protein [Candidatus Gracilibacteria bacterium]|nr:coproporphyrinogen-III oxidase family protein [Candidatus Gracilibacteria bacterium]
MFCYIHIPFCESKCKYCRFASIGNLQEKRIEKYVGELVNEIKRPVLFTKTGLKSVYFGGGTPSVLNLEQLENILGTLKNKFGSQKNIEITLESTPNNITKENLVGWKKLGINRLSIGVQTLNENSLKEIGRGKKGDVIKALDEVKGFLNNPSPFITFQGLPLTKEEIKDGKNRSLPFSKGVPEEGGGGIIISLDFIIGLPHVKPGEIKKDIEYILGNYDFIKHISVYMLEEYYDESKVKSEKGKVSNSKYDNIFYPKIWKEIGIKEEEYLGEYLEVKRYLESRGFIKYEISNFAKPGFECKHNKAYWNHDEVVAFGVAASGFVNGARYTNSDSFEGYYAGEKTLDKLDEEDLFLEKLMFGLRTTGVGKEIYEKLDKEKIDYFINEGYLKFEECFLKLEDKGVLVLDYIIREI